MGDAVARVPVDVEPVRVRRALPEAEHIYPAWVARAGRHMVRHDVEDDAEPSLANRAREGSKAVLAAELRVDASGVDDVVAVHAARHRLGDRREVEMRDAEGLEVVEATRNVRERKFAMKLQAIGAGGDV